MTRAVPRGKPAALVLRLYVAGDSPNSILAVGNLRAAIAHLPTTAVSLQLIDVLIDPELGLQDGVLVTPTLIRVAPAPERRVIGNLRDRTALLAGLGITGARDE
jgi:circadian clock protein KaiB